MGMIKKKRCRNCRSLFVPDCRNHERQNYCKTPECRKASKAFSQKKWLNKPENKNYFKGPVNTQRVREWRKRNPGYWKRGRLKEETALQDPLNGQVTEFKENTSDFTGIALQDLLTVQPAVIIGLISNFIGSSLQDDIARTILLMQQSGQDILFYQPKAEGGDHDIKNSHFTRAGPQGTQKFQLDRSSSGQ
jgi:hypothetical protein